MATPTDENFNDYKKAEKKALEILAAMKAVSAKKVDIELALLVAIFELPRVRCPLRRSPRSCKVTSSSFRRTTPRSRRRRIEG